VDAPYRGAKEPDWLAKFFTFCESPASDIAIHSEQKSDLLFYNGALRNECRHN
jgi:hypothetical protein